MRRITTLCYALLLCVTGYAAEVSLAWDASPSEGVLGYNIYIGTTSRTYSQSRNVGKVLAYTVTGLNAGTTYYFAATAFNGEGESDFSNEVSALTPAAGGCDLNSDGETNILDLQFLSNALIAGTVSPAYDLNGDGAVNILDMQLLANIILGHTDCPN